MTAASPTTLLDKIWALHRVSERAGGEDLLLVDFNVVHEGPFYAFDALAREGRRVRMPERTFAFADHYVPTAGRGAGTAGIPDPEARTMVEQLAANAARTGIVHFGMDDPGQGIMHVVAPEMGVAQPGALITGSDSHTSTNGAFGALGFGVGASQVKHVLATQTIWMRKPGVMRATIDGTLAAGVSAKDVFLALAAKIGIAGGGGRVLEYAGSTVRAMSMAGRMTLCNLAIDGGARSAIVAPDETTFAWLHGLDYAPAGAQWDEAVAFWRTLRSDDGARFDVEEALDAGGLEPMYTWGTSQDEASPAGGRVPAPDDLPDAGRARRAREALEYMGLAAGTRIADIAVDRVFIGSCTNARLDDLRSAAQVARGRKAVVPAMVVPGSQAVKRAAEVEGLDRIFLAAGFEWRDPGCSMCVGANGDRVAAGQRCVSTANRNSAGRQGRGSRTHLASPASAAACAIAGRLADPRDYL